MRKLFLYPILCFVFAFSLQAGGLLTNTNQHIAFLRNPARDASIEIDAVYSNPAGIAFMKDGFHLSLNGQSAYQTRTIKSTFPAFVYNGGSATKKYEGEASAPFVPSVFAVYKTGDWAFSGSFAISGGGGKATFNHGLGSFEAQVALIPALLREKGFTADRYDVDAFMEGRQYIFGLQLGATYKITDYLSAFGGVRMNYVSNSYEGHIRNIRANINGEEMVNVSDYFSTASTQASQMGDYYMMNDQPEMAQVYYDAAQQAKGVSDQTKDKNLDCDQTGWGVTPILGLHFSMDKWNIGVKYEFLSKLNVENKTKVDDTGLFKDGVNTPHDIPALLTVGAQYSVIPELRISAGYHYFFDKDAKMANNKQRYLKHGTHEFLAGVEWDILKWMIVSLGGQRTDYGLGDGYQSDMSFSVSSYSVGGGFAFLIKENIKLNVAYFQTIYDDYTKEIANYAGTLDPIPGTDVFSRTNKVFGIGLDYTF